MPKTNRVSVAFTDAQKEIAIAKIADLKAALPFLISLTVKERRSSAKMGPKSVDYVRQCLEGARAFPDELKKSFDINEMENDFSVINNLLGVQILCKELLELIDDTLMATGIEAMEAASEVYASLKLSAKSNASVKGMLDKIGERYSYKGKGKSSQANSTAIND